jgi:asparaginyl-tRNA synthetase
LKHFGKELKQTKKEIPEWGDDLGGYCERYISEVHFKKPVFVFNYPRDLKSFYMKQNAPYEVKVVSDMGDKTEIRHTVQGCDLLIPGLGELIGSSIRTHDYDDLVAEMTRRKMDMKPMQYYIDARRNGTFPHGGAGLGFDRLVTVLVSGLAGGNIRDVVPFPVAFQECSF